MGKLSHTVWIIKSLHHREGAPFLGVAPRGPIEGGKIGSTAKERLESSCRGSCDPDFLGIGPLLGAGKGNLMEEGRNDPSLCPLHPHAQMEGSTSSGEKEKGKYQFFQNIEK